MEYLITLFIIIILFITFGIGLEKAVHSNLDIFECTRRFKVDTGKLLHILFGSEAQRHVFDASLSEAFSQVLKDYCHDAFPPSYQNLFHDGVPYIGISFVPKRQYTREDVNRLCQLLCLKFRQYIQAYGLNWKVFTAFHLLDETVQVRVYYTEFSTDVQPFFKHYRIAVKHRTAHDFGLLRDEALEKELNHVK